MYFTSTQTSLNKAHRQSFDTVQSSHRLQIDDTIWIDESFFRHHIKSNCDAIFTDIK